MPEDVDNAAVESEDSGGDISPPDNNGWWKFQSKDEAVEWANDKIQKRLAREKSKYDPIVQAHDILKTEVESLRPLKTANQTDTERWESERASLTSELEQLRSFQSKAQRENLVREIADEKGLPTRFVSRVHGDDAESITADIDELLNVLGDGKATRQPASRQPKSADKTPAKGQGGGGSDDEHVSADAILKRLSEKHGGRGRNPFTLTH